MYEGAMDDHDVLYSSNLSKRILESHGQRSYLVTSATISELTYWKFEMLKP